ncbi:hypothetical protein ARMSODRAFT_971721 [Armillaria solidipes]|uniref:Uncharacterized protein n=1 Tax=Armillaria solidipes TaxID=1076256 RepID=A0A2H3BW84_9AGAR|nr:hypothetical protein ARMSODRAFT_971721 [Armillaria solidipes]
MTMDTIVLMILELNAHLTARRRRRSLYDQLTGSRYGSGHPRGLGLQSTRAKYADLSNDSHRDSIHRSLLIVTWRLHPVAPSTQRIIIMMDTASTWLAPTYLSHFAFYTGIPVDYEPEFMPFLTLTTAVARGATEAVQASLSAIAASDTICLLIAALLIIRQSPKENRFVGFGVEVVRVI